MFVMIHLCVTVRKKNQIIRARERIFTGLYNLCLTYVITIIYVLLFIASTLLVSKSRILQLDGKGNELHKYGLILTAI